MSDEDLRTEDKVRSPKLPLNRLNHHHVWQQAPAVAPCFLYRRSFGIESTCNHVRRNPLNPSSSQFSAPLPISPPPLQGPRPILFSFPANGSRTGPIAPAMMAGPAALGAMAGSSPGRVDLPDIPDLSPDLKEKIVCMELMRVNSTKALARNPAIHTVPLPTFHSAASFLLSRGLQLKDLGHVFNVCPAALTLDVSTRLEPVFGFLNTDLGVPTQGRAPRKVINRCPFLLGASVDDQLRPTLLWLQQLGFQDKNSMAYDHAYLLTASLERMLKPRLEWLAKELGVGADGALSMVQRCPGVFTANLEKNLMPKTAYFVEEMKGDIKDLREFPQYFLFSLNRDVMPRHKRVVGCGVDIPLDVMLETPNDEFEQLLKGASTGSAPVH